MNRIALHGLVGIFSVVGAVVLAVLAMGAVTVVIGCWLSLVIAGLVIYGVKNVQWAFARQFNPESYYPPDLNSMRAGLFFAGLGTLGVWYVTR